MHLVNVGVADYRFAPILSEYPKYFNFKTDTLITSTPDKRCLAIVNNQSYDTYQQRGHDLPIVRLVTDFSSPSGGICDPTDVFFTLIHRNGLNREDIQAAFLQGLWNLGIEAYAVPIALTPYVSIDGVDSIIGSSPLTNGPYNNYYVTFWYLRFDITQYDFTSIYKESIYPCLDSMIGSARRVGGLYELIPNMSKVRFYTAIATALATNLDLGNLTIKSASYIDFFAKCRRYYRGFLTDTWIYDGVHP